jgi:hypothetical protein
LKWFADEFFPSTPIRVAIESTGKDRTFDLNWEVYSKTLSPISATGAAFVRKLQGERIRGLLKKALSQAQELCTPVKEQAISQMNAKIDAEISRLKVFQNKNGTVSPLELQWWSDRKANLSSAYLNPQLRLDSFLLIVPEKIGS